MLFVLEYLPLAQLAEAIPFRQTPFQKLYCRLYSTDDQILVWIGSSDGYDSNIDKTASGGSNPKRFARFHLHARLEEVKKNMRAAKQHLRHTY